MKTVLFALLTSLLLLGCVQQNPTATSAPVIDTQDSDAAINDARETGEELDQTGDIPAAENADPTPKATTSLGGGFYEPFTKIRYEQARTEGKTVFLEFYANWCPICKQQEPHIEAAFQEITDESVIGFRVNYNDDDTDDDERQLARQFGVSYQHTHVILDSQGNVKTKSLELWDKNRVLEEIRKAA
ncbi:redoxin domain-containing protein [Candidatus Micrarchaeota archaeon]|nr:redoxin domain-containing protein [Candidatus Micrarchaeota archaeon]